MARPSTPIPEEPAEASSAPIASPEVTASRRARKLQKTLDHIGIVAWQLFETRGFDAVTMEAIAEAADVAKGTLYKYFPVKEALIRHRFEKDLQTYGHETATAVMARPTAVERLALFFQLEADYLNKTRPYLGAYIRYLLRSGQTERGQGDLVAENFVALILREGQTKGEINPDMNADTMAKHLVFMRSGTLIRWLEGTDDSLPAMLEEMLRLFLHGALHKASS